MHKQLSGSDCFHALLMLPRPFLFVICVKSVSGVGTSRESRSKIEFSGCRDAGVRHAIRNPIDRQLRAAWPMESTGLEFFRVVHVSAGGVGPLWKPSRTKSSRTMGGRQWHRFAWKA